MVDLKSFFLSVCGSVLLGAGAVASAPPPADSEDDEPIIMHSDRLERAEALAEEFLADPETCPNYATSVPLVIPVVRNERLFGYAFVTPRLCLSRGVNEFAVMRDMHFVVDQMVKAAHRSPMTLDQQLLVVRGPTEEALLSAARSVLGENRIDRLQLLGSDVRALN